MLVSALIAVLLATAANHQGGVALAKNEGARPTTAQEKADMRTYPWAVAKNDSAEAHAYFLRQHELYSSELEAARESGKGVDVMLYGDSILQCFRYPSDICKDADAVYRKHFGDKYRALNFALGSDSVETLMWRLINGERPTGVDAKAVVMQIGVNDISSWKEQELEDKGNELADKILQAAEYIKASSNATEVVLLGFLPRGPGYDGQWSQPSRFTEVNDYLNRVLAEQAKDDDRVHFVDCSAPLLKADGDIDRSLMPDALHPSGKGFELIVSQCLGPVVDSIVDGSGAEASGVPIDVVGGGEGAAALPQPTKKSAKGSSSADAVSEPALAPASFEGEGEDSELALADGGDSDSGAKALDDVAEAPAPAPEPSQVEEEKDGDKELEPLAEDDESGSEFTGGDEDSAGSNESGGDSESGANACDCPNPYPIGKRESFDSIAEKCGVTVTALARVNGVDFSEPVDLGLEVIIPGCEGWEAVQKRLLAKKKKKNGD